MKRKPQSLIRRVHGIMFKLPYMITCEEFEDFILAYIEGDLPRNQRVIFELHLKLCRECREYLASYRTSMELMKKAMNDTTLSLPEAPEDLIDAIIAARDS
ncbi:MAG: zf-HC2 domain-containing protein [Hyphomicrobiales bacterium]